MDFNKKACIHQLCADTGCFLDVFIKSDDW